MGRFTLLFNLVKRALTRVFRRNKSQGDTVIMDNVVCRPYAYEFEIKRRIPRGDNAPSIPDFGT